LCPAPNWAVWAVSFRLARAAVFADRGDFSVDLGRNGDFGFATLQSALLLGSQISVN
jgi:hypothetical protein